MKVCAAGFLKFIVWVDEKSSMTVCHLYYYITLQYITLRYGDNCFEKPQLLYIVSNYKRYQTDEYSPRV